jgi:hypothetical protein
MTHLTTINWLIDWWDTANGIETRVTTAIEVFLDGALPRQPANPPQTS